MSGEDDVENKELGILNLHTKQELSFDVLHGKNASHGFLELSQNSAHAK